MAVTSVYLTSDEHGTHKKYISPDLAFGSLIGHNVEHVMVMILSPFF